MIEIEGLTKVYETPGETIRVLDGLDLEVATGEAVAIVGPSGSGKTTLLNQMGALDRPDAGSIRVDGSELASMSPAEAERFRNRTLGFVFQQHHLLPQLSALENVLVPRLAGGWSEDEATTAGRARGLLDEMGLGGRVDHFPRELSGGEKLRVALALVNEPALILADEPTGSLDQATTGKVAELLIELNRGKGVTLVMVTHNLALAGRMDRVLELGGGKLAER